MGCLSLAWIHLSTANSVHMANLVDLWNLKTAIVNIHLFDKTKRKHLSLSVDFAVNDSFNF